MSEFISGWVAGVVGLFVGHPFDTIKVNQQTQGIGTVKCTRLIYQHFGLKGFFRGLSFPLFANGAISSIYFGVYRRTLNELLEWEERKQIRNQDKPNYLFCTVAACLAGLVQTFVLCPVDLIKIKLQTDNGKLIGGPTQLIRNLITSYGIRGIYKGFIPTASRAVPGSAIYLVNYEFLSNWVLSHSTNPSSTAIGIFAVGGISGTFACWILLPIDAVKSNMQAEDSFNPKYKGVLHCGQSIWHEQGIRGFLRGFWVLPIRAFPVNGAMLGTLEGMNYLFSTEEEFS